MRQISWEGGRGSLGKEGEAGEKGLLNSQAPTTLQDRDAGHGRAETAGCVLSGRLKTFSGLQFPICKVRLRWPVSSQGFLMQGWGGAGVPAEAQAGGEAPASGTSGLCDPP